MKKAPSLNAVNQRNRRDKQHLIGNYEVRDLYLPKDLHPKIKAYGHRLMKQRGAK